MQVETNATFFKTFIITSLFFITSILIAIKPTIKKIIFAGILLTLLFVIAHEEVDK